jgi:hypothetical protein
VLCLFNYLIIYLFIYFFFFFCFIFIFDLTATFFPKLKSRIRLMKSITDDYVSTRMRSKVRLEMNNAVMRKEHKEGVAWISSERLASAFLTLGIAGSATGRAAKAGENTIEMSNGPENELATYEVALRSPQARQWEEAIYQEWHVLIENHIFDAVTVNHRAGTGREKTQTEGNGEPIGCK